MLTRWNPMRHFEQMERQLLRPFFDQWEGEPRTSSTMRGWIPAVDVEESTDEFFVRAEIPGVNPDDVTIDYENGLLTLRGERRFESEREDRQYHRIERAYGSFTRSFVLPATVDAERAEASFQDGVLELRMPKREEAKPRRIPIGGSAQKRIRASKDDRAA